MNENDISEENIELERAFNEESVIIAHEGARRLGDIVTAQCIICILLAIAYIMLNIFKPEYSDMLSKQYHEVASVQSVLNNALHSLAEDISAFLNAKPNA